VELVLLGGFVLLLCLSGSAVVLLLGQSSGDRGYLCLTPLLHLKDFPGTPLRRIVEDPELRISLIQLTHFCGKPMWVYHLYYDFMFNSVKSFFEVQL